MKAVSIWFQVEDWVWKQVSKQMDLSARALVWDTVRIRVFDQVDIGLGHCLDSAVTEFAQRNER